MKINIKKEYDIFSLSRKIGTIVKTPIIIYLNGNLGIGKTTFAKGFIKSFGYNNLINSPTFSIIKEYSKNDSFLPIYHFDFYRIKSLRELKLIGINDYASKKCIILMEWAEKGENILPKSDIIINFIQNKIYRKIFLYGNTRKGKNIILKLS